MATKLSKKIQLSDAQKASLAQTLNNVSQRVAKRGVHVVVKHDNLYCILEALSKRVVLAYILEKNLAETLCVRLNRPSKHYPITKEKLQRVQKDLDEYIRLYNDTVFYRHTVKVTKDNTRREVTFTRLQETIGRMKLLVPRLQSAL